MVSVTWYEAHDYCTWAGSLIGKEGDLPTEAQWEYAARSRGSLIPFATDNGKLEEGRNIPTDRQLHDMHPESGRNETIRIGRFPPTPLGLYDLSHGGLEWVSDWYDATYYSHSPQKAPQGPATGSEKVLRGKHNSSGGYFGKNAGLVFIRYHNTPDFYNKYYHRKSFFPGNGVRCAFIH